MLEVLLSNGVKCRVQERATQVLASLVPSRSDVLVAWLGGKRVPSPLPTGPPPLLESSKVSYGVEFVEEIKGHGAAETVSQKWPVVRSRAPHCITVSLSVSI